MDIAICRELRLLLEEEKGDLLTSAEEVAYFRSLWKPPVPAKVVPPPPAPIEAIIPPPPPPAPVRNEAPPPPPPAPLRNTPQPVEIASDLSDVRALFKKIAPDTPILDDVPSDTVAKRIGARWKARKEGGRITLFFYQEPPEHRALLEKITHALDIHYGPARLLSAEVIEKKGEWEALFSLPELELVILCDSTLWQLPKLRSLYKELPREHKRLVGDKPLFLLPDLSLYLKDPLLKRSLWKALCQMFPS